MSKKDFTGNFNSLLGTAPAKEKPAPIQQEEKPVAKVAAPKKKAAPAKKKKKTPSAKKKAAPKKSSVKDGTKEGEKRAAFIVNEEQLLKIKEIAYQDRKNIKEVVAEAFSAYLQLWEEKNGAVNTVNR